MRRLLILLLLLALPGLAQTPSPTPYPDTMPVELPEDPGSVVPS